MSNCLFTKVPTSQCANGKRNFKINLIKPKSGNGTCLYDYDKVTTSGSVKTRLDITYDGQSILDESCQDDDCVPNSTDFKDAVKCILKSLQDNFVKKFNDGPGSCSSDKIVKQNMNVFIGPDADLGECDVKLGQTIDMTSKKVCLDINKAIMSLEGTEKLNFLQLVLDDVFNAQSKYVKDRPMFVKKAKEFLLNKLMTIDSSANTKCSQSINISQDQNIYLLGEIKCKNSTFEFTQEAIVKAYMSCITGPFLDDMANDYNLKRLFEAKLDDNCIWVKKLVQPCDGSIRKFRLEILRPAIGNGVCEFRDDEYTTTQVRELARTNGIKNPENMEMEELCNALNLGIKRITDTEVRCLKTNPTVMKINQNDIITENCKIPTCQVSEWSEWSSCDSGGEQTRERKIIKPGEDCPYFTEKRDCKKEIRKRKNSNQKIEELSDDPIVTNYKGYEWLYYGPGVMNEKQKMIMKIVLVGILALWIYVMFFS
jgi:hypothetical protein